MSILETKEEIDTFIKKDKLETIDHKKTTSPSMKDAMDPIEVIQILDHHIDALQEAPDGDTNKRIQSSLKSLEVVTIENGEEHLWLNKVIELHEYTMKRPMHIRIGHLIKTGGEWKEEHFKQDKFEIKNQTILPMSIIVDPETENEVRTGKLSYILVPLIAIRGVIKGMVENDEDSCGVFRKPYGVVHMNHTRAWLEDQVKKGAPTIENQLSTTTLFDIAKTATLASEIE